MENIKSGLNFECLLNNIDETLDGLALDKKIDIINKLKIHLHKNSPFKNEPVDCTIWVKNNLVKANDYNPNQVAPPEMELLTTSIMNDGFTQPIVTFLEDEFYTVIDGFHRNRVGKEVAKINDRLLDYLPVTIIRPSQEDKGNRIASTIRHNRARGKHQIDGMSNIVLELKRRNWSDKKIGKQLGMEPDEVLRLCQITGLAEMFNDKDFNMAWEADISELVEDGEFNEDDIG